MSETASRRLFLAEFVVLALPSLAVLVAQAVTFGSVSLFVAGSAVYGAVLGTAPAASLADAWVFVQIAALYLAIAAIAALGLMAIGKLLSVSLRFWKGGRAGLRGSHKDFLHGLAYAVIPFAIMLRIGWTIAGAAHPVDKLFGLYASGIALLPTILHLWLELRLASTAAEVA